MLKGANLKGGGGTPTPPIDQLPLNQNNPRFLFSTVARLTNTQMSPDLNIPSQFNSNDFMNVFTDATDNIRNTMTNCM